MRSKLAFVVAAVLSFFAALMPARADDGDVQDAIDIAGRIAQIDADLDRVNADLAGFKVADYYCLPPDEPSKATEYATLADYEAYVKDLSARLNDARRGLLSAINNDGRALNAAMKIMPSGGDIQEPNYWTKYRNKASKAMSAIAALKERVRLAPTRRCRPLPETSGTIGSIGTNPPPPPPPPPSNLDLPEVKVRPVEIPPVPDRFCSQAEKQATLEAFWAVNWDFYMNYQDAREYEAALAAALRADRGDREALALALEAASAATKYHANRVDAFQKEYARVQAMPVVDCGPPAGETGDTGVIGDPTEPVTEPVTEPTTPSGDGKPPFEPNPNKETGSAWPFGRIDLGGYYASGDLDYADQHELGTEGAGGANRELGVVDFDRDAEATGYGIDLTVGMPGFGKRDWLRFGYLTLDADTTDRHDQFDTGGDTLLLPGVGEGSNPSGFALSYFGGLNTVTDIVGRFEAKYDSYSLEYGDDCFWGQCDYCDDCDNEEDEEDYWDCYDYYDCDDCYGPRVGIYGGLRYSVVQFDSRIGGSIPGFARDFEYRDRIENDFFSLRLGSRAVIPVRPLRFVKLDLKGYVSADFNDAKGTTRLRFTGFPDGVANLKNDDLTWGYGVGAGITLELTDAIGIRFGGDYTSAENAPVVTHDGTPSRLELERVEGLTWSLGVRASF